MWEKKEWAGTTNWIKIQKRKTRSNDSGSTKKCDNWKGRCWAIKSINLLRHELIECVISIKVANRMLIRTFARKNRSGPNALVKLCKKSVTVPVSLENILTWATPMLQRDPNEMTNPMEMSTAIVYRLVMLQHGQSGSMYLVRPRRSPKNNLPPRRSERMKLLISNSDDKTKCECQIKTKSANALVYKEWALQSNQAQIVWHPIVWSTFGRPVFWSNYKYWPARMCQKWPSKWKCTRQKFPWRIERIRWRVTANEARRPVVVIGRSRWSQVRPINERPDQKESVTMQTRAKQMRREVGRVNDLPSQSYLWKFLIKLDLHNQSSEWIGFGWTNKKKIRLKLIEF